MFLGPLGLQEFSTRLHKLGIAARRPLNTTQRDDVIMVRGRPRHVAIVRQTYQTIRWLESRSDFRVSPPNAVGDFPPYYIISEPGFFIGWCG
jgi:hypothetical protein